MCSLEVVALVESSFRSSSSSSSPPSSRDDRERSSSATVPMVYIEIEFFFVPSFWTALFPILLHSYLLLGTTLNSDTNKNEE